MFLGVYLGKFGSRAVQNGLGDLIAESGDCDDQCEVYYALIMWLCAVVFGSVGCFLGVAALAGTFTVTQAIVSPA